MLTAGVALVVALGLASGTGGNGALVLSRLVVDGGMVLAWLASAAGLGAGVLRILKVGGRGILRFTACVGVGMVALSLWVLGLGLAGALGMGPGLYWGLLAPGWALGAWMLKGKRLGEGKGGSMEEREGGRGVVALGAVVGGVLLGVGVWLALVPPGWLWPGEPNRYDVVAYHFQIPREWWELGRIVPLEHNVFSYMPLGMEMHYLLGMGLMGDPWDGGYVCQLMHLAMFGVGGLGLFAGLREVAGKSGGVVGLLGVAGCPYVMLLAPIGYNEGGMVMFLGVMLGMVLASVGKGGKGFGWKQGLVVGVLGGGAAGVKLTALPMIVGAVGVGLGVMWLFGLSKALRSTSPTKDDEGEEGLGRGGQVSLAGVGMVLVGSLVAFTPWLVRTAVWTGNGGGLGNPVFPLAASVLGKAHWTHEQVQRFEKAHAPRDEQKSLGGRTRAFREQVMGAEEFGWRGVGVVTGGLVCGVLVLGWGGRDRRVLAAGGVTMLGLMVGIWMFATHLQGRFFVPGVVVCAMLMGLAPRAVREVALVLVVGISVWSVSLAWGRLDFLRDPRGQLAGQLVGMHYRDLSKAIEREEIKNVPEEAVLALVGDASAYRYIRVKGKLKYTSVFDVVGDHPLTAWRAGEGDWVWVEPSEVRRLSKTYLGVPGLPPEWNARTEAFLLRPGEGR